jgi:plasmid stabilization system protein ParE
MRVRYRELALSDLDQIFRYLRERSPAGAQKVVDAIFVAIHDVAQNPLAARRTSDPSVRVKVAAMATKSSTASRLTPLRFYMFATVPGGRGRPSVNKA